VERASTPAKARAEERKIFTTKTPKWKWNRIECLSAKGCLSWVLVDHLFEKLP
jgi:hypothetical protein